jgi:hypothetical protein
MYFPHPGIHISLPRIFFFFFLISNQMAGEAIKGDYQVSLINNEYMLGKRNAMPHFYPILLM